MISEILKIKIPLYFIKRHLDLIDRRNELKISFDLALGLSCLGTHYLWVTPES